MIDRFREIQELLNGMGGLRAWAVTETVRHEAQLTQALRVRDSVRSVAETRWTVRLFVPVSAADGRPLQGEGVLDIPPGESAATVRRRLDDVRARALLAPGALWNLPDGGTPARTVLCWDEATARDPWPALEATAADILRAADEEPSAYSSHFELSFEDKQLRLANSQGLEREGRASAFTVYAVVIAESGGRAFDHKIEIHRRSPSQVDMPKEIHDGCKFARDCLAAGSPQAGRFDITADGPVFDNLFDPIIANADAAYLMSGMSRFKPGERICSDGPGTPLTLVSDGTVPMGARTLPFDKDGLPAASYDLVRDGVFIRHLATKPYADFLDLPPTGAAANLVVNSGTETRAELQERAGGMFYYIAAFSFFIPDSITGNFTGEIRLGYEYGPNGVRPVKGGAVAGNLFRDLPGVRFSAERTDRGFYYGPELLRFSNLVVSA